jgi:hypothetical protein
VARGRRLGAGQPDGVRPRVTCRAGPRVGSCHWMPVLDVAGHPHRAAHRGRGQRGRPVTRAGTLGRGGSGTSPPPEHGAAALPVTRRTARRACPGGTPARHGRRVGDWQQVVVMPLMSKNMLGAWFIVFACVPLARRPAGGKRFRSYSGNAREGCTRRQGTRPAHFPLIVVGVPSRGVCCLGFVGWLVAGLDRGVGCLRYVGWLAGLDGGGGAVGGVGCLGLAGGWPGWIVVGCPLVVWAAKNPGWALRQSREPRPLRQAGASGVLRLIRG